MPLFPFALADLGAALTGIVVFSSGKVVTDEVDVSANEVGALMEFSGERLGVDDIDTWRGLLEDLLRPAAFDAMKSHQLTACHCVSSLRG
jgi:hypothetical protein